MTEGHQQGRTGSRTQPLDGDPKGKLVPVPEAGLGSQYCALTAHHNPGKPPMPGDSPPGPNATVALLTSIQVELNPQAEVTPWFP